MHRASSVGHIPARPWTMVAAKTFRNLSNRSGGGARPKYTPIMAALLEITRVAERYDLPLPARYRLPPQAIGKRLESLAGRRPIDYRGRMIVNPDHVVAIHPDLSGGPLSAIELITGRIVIAGFPHDFLARRVVTAKHSPPGLISTNWRGIRTWDMREVEHRIDTSRDPYPPATSAAAPAVSPRRRERIRAAGTSTDRGGSGRPVASAPTRHGGGSERGTESWESVPEGSRFQARQSAASARSGDGHPCLDFGFLAADRRAMINAIGFHTLGARSGPRNFRRSMDQGCASSPAHRRFGRRERRGRDRNGSRSR